MGLRINNNVRSLFATRVFSNSVRRVSDNFRSLSSGQRVSRVSDNVAGYFISLGMNTQSKVIGQVVRNITDGISLAQITDSALSQTQLKIYEIKNIASEVAQSPLSYQHRFARQVEADVLLDGIEEIGSNTRFGNVSLLDGQVSSLRLQSGFQVGDDITVRIRPIKPFKLGRQVREDGIQVDPTIPIQIGAIRINDIDIRQSGFIDDPISTIFRDGSAIAKAKAINDSTPLTGVEAAVFPTEVMGLVPQGGVLDNLNRISINGSEFQGFSVLYGDADKRLRNQINARTASTGVNASVEDGNLLLTAADGRNIEVETTSYQSASATGLNNGSAGLEIFAGALLLKSSDSFDLELNVPGADFAIGIGAGIGTYSFVPDETHSLGTIDLTTPAEAERALDIIDVALDEVSGTRGELGAVLSQLQSSLNANEGYLIHLEVGRHGIQNMDTAEEVSKYARSEIVQSASTSILAQANFGPNSGLSLLRQSESSSLSGTTRFGISVPNYFGQLETEGSSFGGFGRDNGYSFFGGRRVNFGRYGKF
jgi:flagellin